MLKNKSLTPYQLEIIQDKGTEHPGSGKYNKFSGDGTYLCRQCGLALFRSSDKFIATCGWPSFDDEITGTILRKADADGIRTEILCNRCDCHLGHIFHGEGFTDKNARYCVNAISIDFVPSSTVMNTEETIVAAGCFWGVETLMQQLTGVLLTEVGYTGGNTENPSYEDICKGNTGHVEAIRIVYDTRIITYKEVAKWFFEIHDPTQDDGQGPDHGSQYLSKIFYYNNEQKAIATELSNYLQNQGLNIATTIQPVTTFWPAEDYHQDYYTKNNRQPYCHYRVKRF